MKVLSTTLLLIFNVIYITVGSYLDGLNRTFSEVDNKIVDLYVTMPEKEVSNLIDLAQVSQQQVSNHGANKLDDFEYEEAVIVAKYNGEEKTFEKVKFKTGGMYARSNAKVGFNIKLDKQLFGRKNIRLRPDDTDKTHLHSKICSDIANRMGVPSIQGTFARLYMNDEYWGLYTLLDSLKTSWIKDTFNPSEDEITTLYQCKDTGMTFKKGSAEKCYNANDDYDNTVLEEFIDQVNNCDTAEELAEIIDVEVFLKYVAFEWLIGSFDHFVQNGHNFYLYKRETDGKWLLIEHDYDNTFGTGQGGNMGGPVEEKDNKDNDRGNRGGNNRGNRDNDRDNNSENGDNDSENRDNDRGNRGNDRGNRDNDRGNRNNDRGNRGNNGNNGNNRGNRGNDRGRGRNRRRDLYDEEETGFMYNEEETEYIYNEEETEYEEKN